MIKNLFLLKNPKIWLYLELEMCFSKFSSCYLNFQYLRFQLFYSISTKSKLLVVVCEYQWLARPVLKIYGFSLQLIIILRKTHKPKQRIDLSPQFWNEEFKHGQIGSGHIT